MSVNETKQYEVERNDFRGTQIEFGMVQSLSSKSHRLRLGRHMYHHVVKEKGRGENRNKTYSEHGRHCGRMEEQSLARSVFLYRKFSSAINFKLRYALAARRRLAYTGTLIGVQSPFEI